MGIAADVKVNIELYQAIILLLDAEVVKQLDFNKLADDVAHWARFESRLVFPILLEPCEWEKSSLQYIDIYPMNRVPISKWESTEAAWTQISDEIWNILKPYTSFHPETDRLRKLRSIGKVTVGTGDTIVSGFLIAPDVLLTSNQLINSFDKAAEATISFTDSGGLSSSFSLNPSRFFLTDVENGVSLVGISQTPLRSDYQSVRKITDYYTLRIAQETVKPGEQLDSTNFDRAQQLRANIQTVDFSNRDQIQYSGPLISGAPGGPVLNEHLDVVAVNPSHFDNTDYNIHNNTLATVLTTVTPINSLLQSISDRFSKDGWRDNDGILVQDIIDPTGNSLKFNHLYYQPARVFVDLRNNNDKARLLQILSQDPENIQLHLDEQKAEYVVRERSGKFYITYPSLEDNAYNVFRPLAAPVKSDNPEAISILVSDLRHMARWDYLRKFSNPSKINDLPSEPLSIKLWDDSNELIPIDGMTTVGFRNQEGRWECQLRIELTNITNRRLYVCALYLSMEFESYASLLPDGVYTLEPGQKVQLIYDQDPIIHFELSEIISIYNWPERLEYFKFMISTEPYDVNLMRTHSLPEPIALSDQGQGRDAKYTRGASLVSREKLFITNWTTQSVAVRWLNPVYNKTSIETIRAMHADPELNFFATGLYPDFVSKTTNYSSVWQHNGKYILVAGTGRYELTDIEVKTSEVIGVMLANERYGLIGGGWPGVDYLVGKAFTEKLAEVGVSEKDYFTQVIKTNQRPDYKGGSKFIVENDNEWYNKVILKANAVILIGGVGGTYDTFEKARDQHIPIIPLVTTGGDARKVYYRQKKTFLEMYSQNQQLCFLYERLDNHNLTGDQLAQIVKLMLELMLIPLR